MKRRRHSNGVYFDRSTKGEVGTSIAAVRCQSNRDVLIRFDNSSRDKYGIKRANEICDRMNAEVDKFIATKYEELPQ